MIKNIHKNLFCIFCIIFILFISLAALTEYYFNPDYSNVDPDYLNDLSERYSLFERLK